MSLPTNKVARFWSKVDVPASDETCWEWKGAICGAGYGSYKIDGFSEGAHRVAYALHNGDVPPAGQLVRHKCDNRKCVNPFHLEPGTVKDNSRDMVERGRMAKLDQKGAANGNAKLTANDVAKIREMAAAGISNVAIAAQFPVTHQMVSKIKKGYFWKADERPPHLLAPKEASQ